MMQLTYQLAILYIFFWIVRIQGCIRRGRQPRLRGPEWFFNVRVASGFYDGPGRRLLRDYWIRMMIPFAVDIPLAIAIVVTGRYILLPWLVLGLSLLIHVNHLWSVNVAERRARDYAADVDETPVARLALSLQPRRLRDYANPAIEWTVGILSVAGLALTVRYYATAATRPAANVVFGVPLVLLYVQLGMLYVKRVVLSWRRPMPQDHAAEYLEASEQTRRYYLLVCDWYRLTLAISILVWPLRQAMPPAVERVFGPLWSITWIALASAATIWVEIKRKRLAALAVRARPVTLPDFLHQSGRRWPVCYEPSVPMLLLKGARGYSLNLANSLTQASAAYVAGLAVLILVLRMVR